MSKIKTTSDGFGGVEVRVNQDKFRFLYCRPNKSNLKREGKCLRIFYRDIIKGSRMEGCVYLNGRQIKTIAKILKAAKEV